MLYSKYLEWAPSNCTAWCRFAELERSMEESDRARALYELAIAQPQLDVPEVLWKVSHNKEKLPGPTEECSVNEEGQDPNGATFPWRSWPVKQCSCACTATMHMNLLGLKTSVNANGSPVGNSSNGKRTASQI